MAGIVICKTYTMTNTELNQSVKKLAQQIKEGKLDPHEEGWKEFSRIYSADKTLKAFNADSLRLLIALNRKYEYEPIHRFGIHIEW